MTLVELCAGSAAVSLALRGADPPLAYQGGKRAYAHRILAALGLQPGLRCEVVLAEPGPWGEAWDLWRTEAGRAATCERLRAWAGEAPRALWERLRSEQVPGDLAERVAVWAVLQSWNFRGRPIHAPDGRWARTGGFDRKSGEGFANYWRSGDAKPYPNRPRTLEKLAASLRALPDLSHVTVLRCRAEEVEPIPGAICYLDPDYQGTTGYGHTFPRPAVLQVAERWRAAGAVVAVSEAEPLPLAGWHHLDLGRGLRRSWSRQQSEWLTMSRAPAGQQSLWGAA